jgi:hypothetical protein
LILAHGIGGRSDLPIPLWLLLTGATLVLIISFVALAILWPHPRLQDGPRYGGRAPAGPVPVLLRALGLVGLLVVIGQVVSVAFRPERVATRPSIAPVMVWVVFWLVVPFASALIGGWYTDLNPWRTLAVALRIGRAERIGLPSTLGLWPATLVLVAFVWLELIYRDSGDPVTLGIAALGYTVALLGVMARVGRETGLATFDVFTPYNRLFSAMSPLGRDTKGRIVWRGWLRSLTVVPEWPGLWLFVVAMIATVSFDGASGAGWFTAMTGDLGNTTLGRTLLLVGSVVLVASAYYLASAVAASLGGEGWTAPRVAQRFAHTLVPIALAYALSHYFTLILFEGQQLLAAISDPFAIGWDLFGTAERRVEFFITTSTPIWFLQVGFIVLGHVIGVALAHDRSLQDFGPGAVRSQYAMLALMIALTTLGLAVLSG